MADAACGQDFGEVGFPQLAPVCSAARGDALLLLTRAADVWAGRLPRAPVTAVLVPLLARAADQGRFVLTIEHALHPCAQSQALCSDTCMHGRLGQV